MTLNTSNYTIPAKGILVIYILFFFNFLGSVKGQEKKTDSISASEEPLNITLKNESDYSYMNFDICYTNNKINSRRQETKHVPGLLGNISFNHKLGLYSNVSLISYSSASVFTYDYDLTLGFQKDIKNIVDFDLYYDYHGFKGDTVYQGINYDQSIGLSIGLTLKSLYFFAEGYYYFGKTENYFLDFGISAIEQFDEIFLDNDYILLQPTFSATYGTDFWLYENMGPLRKKYNFYLLENRGYSTETFEFQGFDIILPISYGIGDLSLMFAWMYYIPTDKFKILGWTNQSGYIISLSYTLNFN